MNDKVQFNNPAALSALARGDFANALTAATPGGIEAQEKAGQMEVAANFNRLPKDSGWRNEGHAIAERFGFVIGADLDDIFVSVTPPAGWQLRPTDHSMHSDILDEQGRRRGGMFYKAAFYDRKAHYDWSTRYQISHDYSEDYSGQTSYAHDTVTGERLWQSEMTPGREAQKANEEAAAALLDERFPDWRDAAAYW